MGNIIEQAVEILGNNTFTALFDKGYYSGSEFEVVDKLGVEVLVAIPDLPTSSMAPDHATTFQNLLITKKMIPILVLQATPYLQMENGMVKVEITKGVKTKLPL